MKQTVFHKILTWILVLALCFGYLPPMHLHAHAEENPAPANEKQILNISDICAEIHLTPGQLDSNTDGTILSNNVYGTVVNWSLKKGHTLSISDSNYVFSVRKLENGNYSKMLKSATSSDFTATEDMTVAMLVRKPDKSPFTAEELSDIFLYDSQFGMIGTEGSTVRFTVRAETITGGFSETRAAIFLPESYSDHGTPTRLIIMTNGRNGYLTDSVWNGNKVDDVGVMRHYMENDYAVLVVDNTAGTVNGAPDWGNPQLVDSYWKAYEYVQANLNVEERFSIHSRSMGTFAAVRMMREHPELVKCALMCGAVLSLQSRFFNGPAFLAQHYGFDDTTGNTWEADKVVGYDPYTDVDSMEYSLPPTFWMLAQEDATSAHLGTIDKIENHGNDVSRKIYTETDHSGVCRLNIETCREDSLAFLEKYQESTAAHRYYAWSVAKNATCMEPGQLRRNCADCSHYETMEIPMLTAHTIAENSNRCTVCNNIFEITESKITLQPGHFDDTNGKKKESEIYGCVIGFSLKKGHTLSLSNTDYVFAVRKLKDVNYNTLLRGATSEPFTAEEDMVVAIRVRKPDQSVVTSAELASVFLYDTAYTLTASTISLRYDDRYDVTGKTVEIIDAGTPTSYQVGYGVAENSVKDTAVVTLSGDKLIATGIGTAVVKIDGVIYNVEVTAAPISLLLLIGQSNMRGSEGNANQSIVCPDGMVYATYGDDRGESNTAMTLSNAAMYAPSALTGNYSSINTVGTTDCLSGYPVYSLTDAGAGKIGPDSGFAYEWVQQTGEKVWIVNAAHGGTSISAWQPGKTEYEECQALFTACTETLRKEIAAGHFTLSHMAYFWCQGCSDRTWTAEKYVANYLAMHEGFKSELAFDHDSDPATAEKTFEMAGIIPVRVGNTVTCYRDGVNSDQNSYSYHESFVDLRMSGPRVAQYWMGSNPDLTDIHLTCTIGDDWVWMPDGTNGVSDYFNKHYTNGIVDYTTQVKQKDSWYKPTTPKAVHDTIHYNQIGYNELGRESVRNALILLGEKADYTEKTTVKFVDWTGYKEVKEIEGVSTAQSSSLIVPMVRPITRSKDVTYILSNGLHYNYYDLTAGNGATGALTAVGAQGSVTVTKENPGKLYRDHLSEMPASYCAGTNLWTLLEHDPMYFASGRAWQVYSGRDVPSVTIPVEPGDKIFATSFGKAGENGYTSNGIRMTFFGEYSVIKTLDPAGTYAEFSKNGGYLVAPEGATAVNIPMWNNSDDNELYILNAAHTYENGKCTVCGAASDVRAAYQGKVISVLSASTSTFAGYIPTADGFNLEHRARYPQDNLLTDVNETWWMQVIRELDAKLGINESWAGSQVLNTQDTNSGDLGPDAAMASLTRIQNLGANGSPDVILFFGAGNDLGRGVPLGSFDPASAPTKVDLTTKKWDTLADAYVAAIMRLQHFYPNAQIVAMTTYAMPSYVTSAKLNKYAPVLQAICDHYGVPVVDLRDCGVTFSMLPDNIHPNAEGMDHITEAVLGKLLTLPVKAGAQTVYSVTHKLTSATASKHYYKGVSAGAAFAETVSGNGLTVTVTMGGKDVTASVYKNGTVTIPKVTGDLVITAKGAFNADGHLQQLPKSVCPGTNLWTALKPEKIYYTATGWGNTAAGTTWSITFPVSAGDRIWATSLGAYPANGSTANGVRVTWFMADGSVKSLDRNAVYNEFAKNGYITAPQGAVALNVPMTNNKAEYAVYLLTAQHNYTVTVTAPTCTEKGYTTHTCMLCGDSYVDSEVAAKGHKWSAATCDKAKTCSVCKKTEGSALGHKWTAATCDKAKTCSVCGKTEGSALGHKWTAATCDKAKTCSVCKKTEGSATGHKWNAATCETAKTCSVCKKTEGSAAGHKWNAATCESAMTCSVCKKTEGSATGHKWNAATCETAKTCSVCKKTEGSATGHKWNAATCETAKTCSVCKKTEGSAVGHKWTAATCETAKTCSVCKKTEGSALGHKWSAATCDNAKTCSVCKKTEGSALGHKWTAATCDKAKTCSVCKKTEGTALGHKWSAATCETAKTCFVCNKTEGSALGHKWSAATCESAKTCSVCKKTEGSALGHKWVAATCDKAKACSVCKKTEGSALGHKWVAATCDKAKTCSVCKKTEGSALGHKWVAATCDKAKTCSVCKKTEGSALGHKWSAATCETAKTCSVCKKTEGSALGHKWSAATCETAKTCSVCKKTEGSAAGHKWDSGTVTKPATETTEGVKTYKCTSCSKTRTETIPTLSHTHKYEKVVTNPTCTEQGYSTYTCKCGHTYVDNCTNATGHKAETDKAVAATCIKTGLTAGSHCSVCGVTIKAQEIVPAKGHTWDKGTVTKPATEEAEGIMTYKCTSCGETKTASIPVLSHTHKYEKQVTAPTCTEQGYTTYTCKCGHSYVDNYTKATGHKAENDKAVAATCTKTGLTAGSHCSVCGVTIKAQEIVPATGHTWDKGSVTKPATEEAEGVMTYKCSSCGETKTSAIPVLSHTHKYEKVTTAPTCTEQGYSTYTCKCGHSYVDNYVKATGHKAVTDAAVVATCTKTGLTAGSHCSVCGVTIKAQETVPATGHSWDKGTVTKPATEETEGIMTYKCTSCGETKTVSIPVLSHTHKYEKVVTKPTCTDQGYTTYTCKCGHTYVDNYVKATGHKTVTDKAVAAACTKTGLTAGSHCSVCGVTIKAQETVPATGHNWDKGTVTKPATEEAEGVMTYKCTSCGETKTATIPVLSHTHKYEKVTTAPTCTEQGYTTYTCKCGHTYVDNYTNATGHKAVTDAAVAATCTKTGLTEGSHCSVCGVTIKTQETVPATGHNWDKGTVTKPATEEAEGLMTYKCSSCGETKTATIPMLSHTHKYEKVTTAPTCTEQGYTTYSCKCGHSYVDNYTNATGHKAVTDAAVAATCTKTGLTAGSHCSVCGVTIKAQETVPATGHSWDKGTVTKPATEEAEGVMTYKCSSCGETKTSAIPVLSHTHKYEKVTTAPTCTEQGYSTYTCKCGHTYVDNYVKATGHKAVTDADVAATCTKTGFTAGSHCSVCGVTIKAQEIVPAKGHTWDKGTVTKPATEETEGVMTYKCSSCGETKTAVIPVLSHTHKYEKIVTAPTCTEQGYSTYTCKCGHTYVDNYVKATGHRAATDAAVAATCTKTGLTAGSHCSVCGVVIKKQETVPATGHNWDKGTVTKPATEETEGVMTYKCTSCGETKTATIPVLSHTHKYEKVTTAPTCTEQGYSTYNCKCGHTYVDNYTNATGHKAVTDAAVAATCTKIGLTAGSHCSVCSVTIKAQETVPATGHSWDKGTVTKTATEETEGVMTYKCTSCGENKTATIPVLGHVHKYEAEVTEATCTENGFTTYTCVCGDSYTDALVEPLGHDWIEATCLAPKNCDRCGTEEGEALGHSFSEWRLLHRPSCTSEGQQIRICDCGAEEIETIPVIAHDYKDFHCKTCNAELKEIQLGDVNGDNKLTYEDALKILRYSINLEELKFVSLADINGDGNVNYSDALTILRRSIGLE